MRELTKSWIICCVLYITGIFLCAMIYSDLYARFLSTDLYLIINVVDLYMVLYECVKLTL